jgi:hypothetical protein
MTAQPLLLLTQQCRRRSRAPSSAQMAWSTASGAQAVVLLVSRERAGA